MKNKKGNLMSALNDLPQAVLFFVVFSITLSVGFKFIQAILSGMTTPAAGVSSFDNWTYNNISALSTGGLSQFTTNSSLIATIVVMSIVLSIVIGAFSVKR